MPKIPDQIGYQAAPRISGVVTPRVRSTTADGLVQGVQSVAKDAMAVREKQDELAYTKAKGHFLLAQSESLYAMEDPTYYNELGDQGGHKDYAMRRYGEEMNQALGEARAMLTNPRDRELFDVEMRLVNERGMQTAGNAAFEKESSFELAAMDERIQGYIKDGVSSLDPSMRMDRIEQIQAEVEAQRKRGTISDDKAQSLNQEYTRQYALDVLGAQDPQTQIDMLRDTSNNVTKFLNKNDIKALERAAIAQRDADITTAERAREVQQKELQREVWDLLEQNAWDIASLPKDKFLELDASRQTNLLNMSERMAKGQARTTDEKFKAKLEREAALDPTAFLARDLEAERYRLSDQDYEDLNRLQIGVFTQQRDALAKRQQLLGKQNVIKKVLELADFDPTPKDDTSEADEVAEIEMLASRAWDNFILASPGNRTPTDAEYTQIVSAIVADQVRERDYLWDKTTRSFEVDSPDDLPEADVEEIKRILQVKGLAETDENIVAMFRAMLTGEQWLDPDLQPLSEDVLD